jgi:hypothetical protein
MVGLARKCAPKVPVGLPPGYCRTCGQENKKREISLRAHRPAADSCMGRVQYVISFGSGVDGQARSGM